MPKKIVFLPNRMEFKIQRTNDTFTVEYTEYYDYLPNELLESTINTVVQTLKKAGVTGYTKQEKGLTVTYSGTLFQILGTILSDLLNHTEKINFEELAKLMNEIHTILHSHSEFISEWNKEVETKLAEYGKNLLKNPLTI